ncbi:hypothetical protein ATY76_22385 [Rhizobium sp. R339]|uniref:hypothetical protein n=1 Tax=Rhizobium sp. R339 TaxID=1764273 RepID=UPI000B536F04|nr:hypothetical protein [Rhizobium sp. R339]OWV64196.1 hypothetical protein ATY76_22385 [Rhizobium sp. R339]
MLSLRTVLALLMTLSFTETAAQEVELPTSAPARQAPRADAQWIPFTIEALGNASLSTNRVVEGELIHYYVSPYFVFDVEAYKTSVATECQGKSASDTATAVLSFELASNAVNDEIEYHIATERDETSKPVLSPYPFGLFLLYSGNFSSLDKVNGTIRWSSPPNAGEKIKEGFVAPSNAFDFTKYEIDILDSCGTLEALGRGNGDFQASIFTAVPDTKTRTFTVSYAAVATAEAIQNLTMNQRQSGMIEVTSSSGSKSKGLNLGVFSSGKSSSNGKIRHLDSRRRAVSANVVESVIRDVSQTIIVKRVRDSTDENTADEIENKLLDTVLKNADQTEASIQKISDEQYELVSDITEELTKISKQDAELLIKSLNKPELAARKNVSGEFAGVKGQSDTDTTVKNETQIEVGEKGSDWVPTKVTLYLVGEADLRKKLVAIFEDVAVLDTKKIQRVSLIPLPRTLTSVFAGPRKEVLSTKTKNLRKVLFKDGKKTTRTVFCLPPETTPRGEKVDTMIYPADKSPEITGSGGTECAKAGFCYRPGDKCLSFEKAGSCLINIDWVEWYKKRQDSANLAVSNRDICKKPGTTP